MANLGNLWFGSDVDLSNLKKKIQDGNKELLDALKMNYDTKSYTDMVNRLKSNLSSEVFEIKVNANIENIKNEVNGVLSSANNKVGNINQTKIASTDRLIQMRQSSNDLDRIILKINDDIYGINQQLKQTEKRFGSNSFEAKKLRGELEAAKKSLAEVKYSKNVLGLDMKDASIARAALAQATKDASKATKDLESDSVRLNTTLSNGIHISTQLGSALSNLFAVNIAQQFLGTVIEIGGQLEMQRVSIGAILNDTAKANTLFEQIKDMAVRSPKGVLELDQFSKQLTAYGFEYNELYDTVRRIADISAGAGTDMSRLANAIGHVRSQTYLSGMVLKQFAMNNIPMVQMLADYYTELEHKVVSTSDVIKRISERKVSYTDVMEQIKRMTDEGGRFFNMQEKVADTLAAKWKNVHDAMDIMYGDIAESFVGDWLKNAADGALTLAKSWREVGVVMGAIATVFGLSRGYMLVNNFLVGKNTNDVLRNTLARKQQQAAMLRVSSAYRTLTAEEQLSIVNAKKLTAADVDRLVLAGKLEKEDLLRAVATRRLTIEQAELAAATYGVSRAELEQVAATNRLTAAYNGLKITASSLKALLSPSVLATAAIAVGAEIYASYESWKQGISDEVDAFIDNAKSSVRAIKDALAQDSENGKPTDANVLKERVKDMKTLLKDNNLYTDEIAAQIKASKSLNEQYDILNGQLAKSLELQENLVYSANSMKEALEATRSNFELTDISDRFLKFGNAIGLAVTSIKALKSGDWNDFTSFFDVYKDAYDFIFNDDITKNTQQMLDALGKFKGLSVEMNDYKESIEGVVDEMIRMGEVDEQLADSLKGASLEDQILLLADSNVWDKFVAKVSKSDKEFAKFAKGLKKDSKELVDTLNELVTDDLARILEDKAKKEHKDLEEYRRYLLSHKTAYEAFITNYEGYLAKKSPILARLWKFILPQWLQTGELKSNVSLETILKEAKKAVADLNKTDEDTDPTTKTTGHKEDALLKKWQDRFDALKDYYDEVQKYVKQGVHQNAAMKKVEQSRPDIKNLFGGDDATYENYAKHLRALYKETNGSTEQRRGLQRKILDALGEFDRDGVETQLKKNESIIKDYISNIQSQWKLYNDILSKTNRRDLAKLAFSNNRIWDDASRAMLDKFNQLREQYGVTAYINWDMNEEQLKDALRDASETTQRDLVDLAQSIQKITKENYNNFLKTISSAYKESMTSVEKLKAAQDELKRLEKERDEYNGDDAATKAGFEINIKAAKKRISELQWDAFKETEDWGRIFGNLGDISTETLNNLIEKLRAVAPLLGDNVDSVKALYEAIAKIEKETTNRNPLKAISNAISRASALRKYYRQTGSDGILANDELSRLLNVKLGSKVTKSQLRDALKKSGGDLNEGIEGLYNKFRALEDVLSPVIDLFDTLGMSEVGDMFNIGEKALGVGSQVELGLKSLGLSEKASMWGAIAGAALSVTTSLLSMHDNSLQKEIEASQQRQKEMDNLYKKLEKVLTQSLTGAYNAKISEKQMADLYNKIYKQQIVYGKGNDKFKKIPIGTETVLQKNVSEDTLAAYKRLEETQSQYDAMKLSLSMQIDELRTQMAKEEAKKGTDRNFIKECEDQIDDLNEQIRQYALDMANDLYSIDIKSWAKSLGDVIYDAWQRGANGLDAYRDKVKELIADSSKNMLVQSIIGNALSDVEDYISREMDRTTGALDPVAFSDNIASLMNDVFDKIDQPITSTLDAIDAVLQKHGYTSLKTSDNDSSLSAGVKGITETQADLLASYMNGMRGDLSLLRDNQIVRLQEISAACVRGNVLAEQQVAHLNQIATNTGQNAISTREIYDLLRNNINGMNKFAIK